MRRQTTWQVQRTVMGRDDGQRRWDTAYQLLLQWARDDAPTRQAVPAAQRQEVDHDAGGAVCACVDDQAAAGAGD